MTLVPVNRLAGIGASELGDLAGVGWRTPVAVWLDKVGLASGPPQSAPMRVGLGLERALLRLLSDQIDVRLTHNRVTFRHPDWPDVPMFATPDGFGPHRWTAAEIKVVGPGKWDDWRTGPPEGVFLQAQGQMECLPRTNRVWVGALIGSEVRSFAIDRDPAIGRSIVESVTEWWTRYVVPEQSPEPETPEDTWSLLRARVAAMEGAREERLATDAEEVTAAELVALLGHADELDGSIEERRRALAAASGDCNVAGHGWRATWSSRRSVDYPAMVREERIPERVLEKYARVSPTFTFRRTKATEEDA